MQAAFSQIQENGENDRPQNYTELHGRGNEEIMNHKLTQMDTDVNRGIRFLILY
jgi:hypothetical protein